ncbi:MAG: autoinducer 2 ABC transporter substrate-binding protein [Clostridiaceae bacterium]|nr:autoinducer 2 ABC transporter substrate-binding protein [Clostridiaceae bacterium]
MFKKSTAILLVIALMATLLLAAGCGGDTTTTTAAPAETTTAAPGETTTEAGGETTAPAGEAYKIVVMPKLIGIPYFNRSEEGALKAGEDLGVEVIYNGPSVGDAAQQVQMIEDYIIQEVDAICVAPNDAAALTPALQKAKDAGIVVLDWDTPAEKDLVELSVKQIDDREFAELYFDQLVELSGTDEGEYAIITGGLAAANLNTWIDFGMEYAAEKYPNLKLVTDKIASDESADVAYQKALDLLKTYPNLIGILGYSTPAPVGIAKAVQERGLQGEVVAVGSAMPTDSAPYLKDGSMSAAFLWDPATLGYLTVYLAKTVLDGGEVTDGMDVPNVGKIRVDGKDVVMGPPSVFTAENVDDFPF